MSHLSRILRSRVFELLFLLLLAFCVRIPYINMPFDRDEGGYAYGVQVMKAGGMPYRDTFEHKGPAPFYLYQASFALFGESFSGVHLLLNLWNTATVLALYVLALVLFADPIAAFFAGIAYIFLSFKPLGGMGTAAVTELFMVLPVTLSALALMTGIQRRDGRFMFLSGVAIGAAVMTKQTAVLEGIFFLGFALARLRKDLPLKKRLAFAAWYCLGGAVVPLLILTHFVMQGAGREFIRFALLYNLHYRPNDPVTLAYFFTMMKVLAGTMVHLMKSDVVFAAGLVAGGAALFFQRRTVFCFLGGWLLFAGLALFAGFRFYLHYHQQYYGAWALIAGVGLAAWYRFLRSWIAKQGTSLPQAVQKWVAVTLLLAVTVALPVAVHAKTLFSSPAALAKENYDGQPFVESIRIGEYLRGRTGPGDTVYIFGSEPQILFYAQRRSSTRFCFLYPLWERFPGVHALQEQVVAELKRNRPKYIVVLGMYSSHLFSPARSDRYLFEETRKLVDENYELDGVARVYADRSAYFFGSEALAGMRKEDVPCNEVKIYRQVR